MAIPFEYSGKCFYHFTHIDNIESIVRYGLLSTNEKNRLNITHANLANQDIQERRRNMNVPIFPGGTVHDYVPFYFASINPMLLGILNRKIMDQPYIVFIAVPIERLSDNNVIFTDASANTTTIPSFYNNPQELNRLNWELIDSLKWKRGTDNELHSRMAEVLIYQRMPIDWINSYIVFNEVCRNEINQIYQRNGHHNPNISYDPFNGRHFYFTKFSIPGRENETLVTGPRYLKAYFDNAIHKIINDRAQQANNRTFIFNDLSDALLKIRHNFCAIRELENIFGLETDNYVHQQTVSDHTLQVVSNLNSNRFYRELSEQNKKIVQLSAYLHDIGKGPREKWINGIQLNYPDHPADSVPMVTRILTEDFCVISDYEIRKVCLLVFYHDLIGDILSNGRDRTELINLHIDSNELYMLSALSLADVSAINNRWASEFNNKIDCFIGSLL